MTGEQTTPRTGRVDTRRASCVRGAVRILEHRKVSQSHTASLCLRRISLRLSLSASVDEERNVQTSKT